MHYKDLIVWQKSIDLVVEVYALTKAFPREEVYGISSQMRRSAVSIASNIAEGSKRGTKKDYRHFLLTSLGSGAELETQLIIAKKLKFEGNYSTAEKLLDEVMRILTKLCKDFSDL